MKLRNLVLGFSSLVLIATTQSAQAVTLTPVGSCPGLMDFEVTGATPNGRVAYVYAFGLGSFVIPGGYPCTGVVMGLDNSATLYSYEETDASGSVTITVPVPAWVCGNVYLQVVDADPCTLSGVILII
ncbi:MAG: hypothetical protein CME06_16655 [Gemmatimonadetes bacterium]|nr:hypothetical protein [Gemmatimonadota bacterium]